MARYATPSSRTFIYEPVPVHPLSFPPFGLFFYAFSLVFSFVDTMLVMHVPVFLHF